jgi:fumarate hydratase class II
MAQEQLIMAIGRIERALSRLEQLKIPSTASGTDIELQQRHNRLKHETSKAIRDIDALLQRGA